MKKKTLMSIVLLAIIGTSAVLAQAPTLDKLKFGTNGAGYTAMPKDKNVTGAVVIPATYDGKSVVSVNGFRDTNITSVVILEGVPEIGAGAFIDCNELTSITFPSTLTYIGSNAFVFSKTRTSKLTSITFNGSPLNITNWGPNKGGGSVGSNKTGDNLIASAIAGGQGTYTRSEGGEVWTKQGGFSLSGVWTRADGMKITIADNGANIVITGDKPNNGGKLNDTYNKR